MGDETELGELSSQGAQERKVRALFVLGFWLAYLTIERTNRNGTTMMPFVFCTYSIESDTSSDKSSLYVP